MIEYNRQINDCILMLVVLTHISGPLVDELAYSSNGHFFFRWWRATIAWSDAVCRDDGHSML